MKTLPVFLKILPTLAMLLAVEMPAKAVEAGALPAQSAPMETTSAPVSGLPAPQSSATLPPDSSPFVPDGPEKVKRVKKLLNQITATYGLRFGREIGAISWGPRLGKLYTLHKKLTNDDWRLLAEMYVSFVDSDLKIIAGVHYNSEDTLNMYNAMETLLAMHGKASINTLNAMVASASNQSVKYKKNWRGFELYSKAWSGNIDTINRFSEGKVWSRTSEYKKDQEK